jgi:hypothetical protein
MKKRQMNELQRKRILVIAESGFIMDSCLEESQQAKRVLDIADFGQITIAIPQYAMAEVDGSLHNRLRAWTSRLQEMIAFLNQLARSQPSEHAAEQAIANLHQLIDIIEATRTSLNETVALIERICYIIPFSMEIYALGKLRALGSPPPFDENDCQIYEAILAYLRQSSDEYDLKLFLTHDRQHFDLPEIHAELGQLETRMVFSAGECLRCIRESLS